MSCGCGSATTWGAQAAPLSTFTPGTEPSASWASVASLASTWECCCDDSAGVAPTLISLTPSVGQVGSAVSVALLGTGFTADATVQVSGSGVTVSAVVVGDGDHISATLTIASGAAVSARTVTVTTSGGTSNAITFTVQAPVVANCELWLDATRTADITIATGVSAWADAQGNGRSVVQATGGAQPTLVAAAINGLQAVRFDGTNDALTLAWPAAAQLNAGSTVFAVVTPRFANDTNYRPLVRLTPSNSATIQHNSSTDSGNVGSRSRITTFISTNAGTKYAYLTDATAQLTQLIVSRVAPAEPLIALYKNGVLDGTTAVGFATVTTSVGDTFRLGVDDSANFGAWDVGEILVFSRALTTAERRLVEAYLTTKWGL